MITLLDVVFDTSAILLLVLAALPLLRRCTAALRHWVLAAALFCAALAPLAEAVLPAWTMPVPVPATPLALPWNAAPVPVVGEAARVAPAGPVQSAFNSGGSGASSTARSFTTVWIGGTVISLAMLGFGLLRLRHLTHAAVPLTDSRWLALTAELRTTYGIDRPVDLRQCRSPGLLVVWGWRHPTLLVPVNAGDWSRDRIAAVLRHELAHVARNDWITQIGAETVRALHWYNPLVWAACARLHVECERACDDAVLEGGVDGSQYASHLLDIARNLRPRVRWTPAPAIARASTLERRVKAMLDRTINRRPPSRRTRSISLGLLLAASVALTTLAAAQQFSSLTGTIVDPTNALLPGVKLVLTNEQTKAKYEIQTDRTGRYEFVGLPPGSYTLETQLPGFAVFRGAVTVTGQAIQQNVTLAVGTLQERITIVGGDKPERLSPDEQRARELEKAAEERKIAEYRLKRAQLTCPGNPGGTGPAIGGNIRTPRKLRDVRPEFPDRLRGSAGDVVLQAVIGTDGRINAVDVVSTTDPGFAASAIEAVKQWEFDATLLNCTPIETAMQVTVHFDWR